MKTKTLVLSIFICFFTFKSKAQTNTIHTSFGFQGIEIPDTVTIGDTIYFSCWVINDGNDVLAENILLKAALFDTSTGQTNIRTIGGVGPNFIYPGDSIQFIPGFLFEVVITPNYMIGDNIVVIWPKADIPSSINQNNQHIYKNVHVLPLSSIASISDNYNNKPLFYPQPARNQIFLNPSYRIKSVQIFNILGKNMGLFKKSSISISHLPEGIYVVKICTEKGINKTEKLIIKQ